MGEKWIKIIEREQTSYKNFRERKFRESSKN